MGYLLRELLYMVSLLSYSLFKPLNNITLLTNASRNLLWLVLCHQQQLTICWTPSLLHDTLLRLTNLQCHIVPVSIFIILCLVAPHTLVHAYIISFLYSIKVLHC